MYIKIVMTIIVFIIMIIALAKKMNGPMVLMGLGLGIMAMVTLVTGTSVLQEGNTGFAGFDIFQVVYKTFVSAMSGTILQLMCVMGYVEFMKHIKASSLMAHLALQPLRRMKSKYIVLVLTFLLGAVLKMFISSQVSMCVMLFATVYPILVRLGFSRTTAVSSCILSTMLDYGPACPNTGWVFNQEYVIGKMELSEFFVRYQIPVSAITILAVIITFVLVTIRSEKRTLEWEAKNLGVATTEETTEEQEELSAVPKYYAIFPLLPAIFVVVFSELVVSGITLNVSVAHLLCFVLVYIVTLIHERKTFRESFNNGAKALWNGMGRAVTSTGVLVASGTVFSTGLQAIGGTTVIVNALSATSFGSSLITVAASGLVLLIAFITGSGGPGLYSVVPLLPEVATNTGMDLFGMILPALGAGGIGRSIALVGPAVLIGVSQTGISNIKIVLRNLIPALVGYAVYLIISILLYL